MATIQLYNNTCADTDLSSDVLHSYSYTIIADATPSHTVQPEGTIIYDLEFLGKVIQSIQLDAQVYNIGRFTVNDAVDGTGATITLLGGIELTAGTDEFPNVVIVNWKYA